MGQSLIIACVLYCAFLFHWYNVILRLPSLGLGTVLLSVGLGTCAALCHLTTSGPCLPHGTPYISSKGNSFYIGTPSTAAAAVLPDCFIIVFKIVGCCYVTKCIFILLKLSCSLLFPKWLVCQGTLFRLCLGCLGDAFHASVAVKSALRLPPSFWHCLCLAILFICLNLVRSSPCGAGEIRKALPILLSYPTVVGR